MLRRVTLSPEPDLDIAFLTEGQQKVQNVVRLAGFGKYFSVLLHHHGFHPMLLEKSNGILVGKMKKGWFQKMPVISISLMKFLDGTDVGEIALA